MVICLDFGLSPHQHVYEKRGCYGELEPLSIFVRAFCCSNSLAIIQGLFAKLRMSLLRVKGSFTHFSVTHVGELPCSLQLCTTVMHNSIFVATSGIVVSFTTPPHKSLKLDNQLEGITIPNQIIAERRMQKACPSKIECTVDWVY